MAWPNDGPLKIRVTKGPFRGTLLAVQPEQKPESGDARPLTGASVVDTQGQVWLPGVLPPCFHRVADVCVQELARMFCEKCPLPSVSPLPAELDKLSLACLLLAAEWGNRSPEATSASLAACLDKAAGRFWGDLLPWQLALGCCHHNPRGVCGTDELTANLDHHNSSIRLWMFELAWCIRNKVNGENVVPRLLKNVADTLSHVSTSLSLCRAMFPTDEAFWRAADEFRPPPDFEKQYRERIALARKEGLAKLQSHFEGMELGLRQLICETALGLETQKIKSTDGR